MRTETVEVPCCCPILRAQILSRARFCAWRHWLTFSHEEEGRFLRITVTGYVDEVERYVDALHYVFD